MNLRLMTIISQGASSGAIKSQILEDFGVNGVHHAPKVTASVAYDDRLRSGVGPTGRKLEEVAVDERCAVLEEP